MSEKELIELNPKYALVRNLEGKQTTILLRGLALAGDFLERTTTPEVDAPALHRTSLTLSGNLPPYTSTPALIQNVSEYSYKAQNVSSSVTLSVRQKRFHPYPREIPNLQIRNAED